MSNSNKHIEEFLNYYLEHETSPDYAVLITGCWGSGKTYFIRQYLGGNRKEVKDWLTDCEKYTVVYVSLFGAKSRDEMDKRVLETLHPKLNSKIVKAIPGAVSLIGKIAGTATANPFVTIAGENIAVFTENLLEAEKKAIKKVVVVFDDVERADMPLPELLGYLNEYVEHLHIPCILLADKDKWEEAQKCQEDKSTLHHLSSTKEKVIGKEFQIQISFDEVWNLWFNPKEQLLGDKTWRLLNDYHDVIAQIFELSKAPNYRSLKHALFDFQRFIGNIQDKYLTNSEFNSLLIADFIAHQYTYYLGWFSASEYAESNATQRAFAKGTAESRSQRLPQEESVDDELYKKYPKLPYERFEETFDNVNRLSSYAYLDDYYVKWRQIWKDWFTNNFVETSLLNDVIRDSIWFDKKDNYYLNKMYDWFMLDDETGNKAMVAFEKALCEKKLISPISIMCLCSKLYWLARRNVFAEKYDAFCKKIEDYVETAKDKLKFENVDEWTQHTMWDSSIYNECKTELDRLQALLKKVLSEKESENKQIQMDVFLKKLCDNNYVTSENTCTSIIHNYLDGKSFNFCDLDPKDFCEAYHKINRHVTHHCFESLKRRYQYHPEQLEKEKTFLQNLLQCASEIYENAERPLTPSIFAFYYLIRTIKEIFGEKENVA